MREREMRQRIERFLQTRLRRMLAPATIGLGLAMTACPGGGMNASDGGALVDKDAAADSGAVAVYSAPTRDAAGTPVPFYGAFVPDAGGPDQAATKYLTQIPDAGPETTPPMRYMAQMPDAAPDSSMGGVPLYYAQAPKSSS